MTRSEMFWRRIRRDTGPAGECWEWQGSRQSDGYGFTSIHDKTRKTHRVAWELVNGPIPAGLCVLHRCDNPPCCNPAHLFLGTVRDNHADQVAKGRTIKGQDVAGAKLTPAKVLAIRAAMRSGANKHQIALEYGVSESAIRNIVNRVTWAHVQAVEAQP